MKKITYALVAIGCFAVFYLYHDYAASVRYALNPQSKETIIVEIPEGAPGSQVAQLLYEKKLIKNPTTFNFYLRQKGLGQKLKAGRFALPENFDLPKIVDALAEGKSAEFSVTLLEGWTVQQIADYLQAQGLTTANEFLNCIRTCSFEENFLPEGYLEGYLYPDTYFVDPGSYSDEKFIARLLNNFKVKLTEEDWAKINASEKSFEDIMIMASIVEREERAESERATVAGILWNRFDAGIGLGADATVLYGLGRTNGGLTSKDLDSDSPYNTRKYAGLPPTPISNPSISSIRAALNPEQTDYWYYLHDPKGGIHYAKTLEEHNSNKAKYLY